MDVRKYFDSIGHETLKRALSRRIKDARLLVLMGRIIDSYRGVLGRGLPIGSLTSQHFANFYLDRFDRLVKEDLRIRAYVRYMDDMVIWGKGRGGLDEVLSTGSQFLADQLGLALKPTPFINRSDARPGFPGRAAVSDAHDLEPPKSRAVSAAASRPGSQTRRRCDRRTRIPATGDSLDRIRLDERDLQLEVPAEAANVNPGERSNGSNRVIRGGSWNNAAENCRAAYRNRNTPTNTNNNLGLRLARAPRRCGGRTGRNRPLSCSARADKYGLPECCGVGSAGEDSTALFGWLCQSS